MITTTTMSASTQLERIAGPARGWLSSRSEGRFSHSEESVVSDRDDIVDAAGRFRR